MQVISDINDELVKLGKNLEHNVWLQAAHNIHQSHVNLLAQLLIEYRRVEQSLFAQSADTIFYDAKGNITRSEFSKISNSIRENTRRTLKEAEQIYSDARDKNDFSKVEYCILALKSIV